ncbi:Zinc finger RING-type protein [Macrophomina phaseolina MS6]|uniref:Zinc finger RING-type protein n=1 Tax=Macrophomina phaseolina (strain MS6) TaxID=1126212 RepID=K2R9M8_MACPH|nr:Zinc finger RING-type protein [Macrophomina phaseolina MS6]
MDFTLRCNSLKCRTKLSNRAVVTTCSHIFCIDCTNELGLSKADSNIRVCPACDTPLTNPDDAVETRLDPTEDYKTSVLSGLSPTIIMECAGRALAFYSYQTTQEIMYQEYLANSLTEKYTALNAELDKVVHDANVEITNLRGKLQMAQQEQKRLDDEMHKMADAFREKSKNQAHLQKVYTQLKAQVLAGQVASAASDDAEATLESATGERFANRLASPGGAYPRLAPGRNGPCVDSRRWSNGSTGSGDAWRGNHGYSARNVQINATPQHRTRLGDMNVQTYHPSGDPRVLNTPIARNPLGNLAPNSFSGAGGNRYGLSAGMRSGKQTYPTADSRLH